MEEILAQVTKYAPAAIIAAAIGLTSVVKLTLGRGKAGRIFMNRLVWMPSMLVGLAGSAALTNPATDPFNWCVNGMGYMGGALSAVLIWRSVTGRRKTST